MTTQILLPKLGFAMNEGVLSAWLQPDGAVVTQGQPLFTLENEKALEEVESPASGTLKIFEAAGNTYPVGTVLGEIS